MLDQLTPKNVKFLIVGYLNSEESSYEISNSMDAYGLKHLIKCSTCYKSVSKSSSTKFFLKVFLDIVRKLTDDIRGLQAKIDKIGSKNQSLLIDKCKLKK